MRRILVVFAVVACVTGSVSAADRTELSGSLRLRGEAWRWFETPGFDDQYLYGGSLLRVALAHRFNAALDGRLEIAQPTLVSLPSNAIAPGAQGQLGLGGTYYAANGEEMDAGLFVKQAWVRMQRGPFAARLGRFEFSDGTEVAPKDPLLARIKRERVAFRLLGNFGFSHVGRSLDGAHATLTRGPMQGTLVIARPTAGAFTVNGGPELDFDVLYAALIQSGPVADARFFVLASRDRRDVLKTDNRLLADRRNDTGDVEIATVGGHYATLRKAGKGSVDVMGWGAIQRGDWGALDHRAAAFALEGGYHWKRTSLRAGAFRSSGDGDAFDGEHETFYQVLPTPRLYARFPFYNAMNSSDLFVQAWHKPTPKLSLSAEIHRLRLSNETDLWYSGGGAFDDRSFGFAGRVVRPTRELTDVIDLSAEYAFTSRFTMTVYAAHAAGGSAIEWIYPGGANAQFFYLEFTRTF